MSTIKMTVALCMIVKDEEKVIRRALESVKDLVDYVCICDTGSSDDTKGVIRTFLEEEGIEGEVFDAPWVDFAHNRNIVHERARGKCTYRMTLDADEVLVPCDKNWKPDLEGRVKEWPTEIQGDLMYIKTVYGSLIYDRAGLFRDCLDWKWVSPVHEVCVCSQTSSMERSPSGMCVYVEWGLGARSKDPKRYEKDALAFEKHLEEDPADCRAWFYLAQSYRDAGLFQRALTPLEKAIELSKWPEEKYVALLRAFKYRRRLGEGDPKELVHFLLQAINVRPERKEAYYYLANYYRLEGLFAISYTLGKAGLESGPHKDSLFVEHEIDKWMLLDETSISAYWVAKYKYAAFLGMKILQESLFPEEHRKRLLQNYRFAYDKLGPAFQKTFLTPEDFEEPTELPEMNVTELVGSPALRSLKKNSTVHILMPSSLATHQSYGIAFFIFARSIQITLERSGVSVIRRDRPPTSTEFGPDDFLIMWQIHSPGYDHWGLRLVDKENMAGKKVILVISEPMWKQKLVKSPCYNIRDWKTSENPPKYLESGGRSSNLLQLTYPGIVEVWDYSPDNLLAYSSAIEVPCRLVLPGWCDGLPLPARPLKVRRDIDAVFYGTIRGTRRERVAESLQKKGFNILIQPLLYGLDNMAQIIHRTRIVPIVHRRIHTELDPYRYQLPLTLGALVLHDDAPEEMRKLVHGSVVFTDDKCDIEMLLEKWLRKSDEELDKERQMRFMRWKNSCDQLSLIQGRPPLRKMHKLLFSASAQPSSCIRRSCEPRQIPNSLSLFKVFMSEDVLKPVNDVLMSGYISQGRKVQEFERELEKELGTSRVLVLNSATSGLTLAHRIIKDRLGEGEVLSCPLTCMATNLPILACGMKIKWVDVNPRTCNMCLDDLERKISETTKAITFVHWGGYPVDLDRVKEILDRKELELGFRPIVVEDCAHGFLTEYKGKKLGSHGNFAVFSTQAIKHLTTGDGGIIVCPDLQSYEKVKLLRWYGIDREKRSGGDDFRLESDVKWWGYKFHMNDINATIGLGNLPHISGLVSKNIHNARYLTEELSGLVEILHKPSEDFKSAYWLFSILVERKAEFIAKLKEEGIMASQVHHRNDLHSCFANFRTELPNLDLLVKKLVCIPVGWWLDPQDLDRVANAVRAFCQPPSLKVLVTGSSGFLGKRLSVHLVARGHVVKEFDLATGQDILDTDAFVQDADGCDAIIHLAACSDLNIYREKPELSERLNFAGTRNAIKAAETASCRLLFASTCCCYGNDGVYPSDETSPPAPTEPYAKSKAAMEPEVRALGEKACCMRLATFYGPGMRAALAPAVFLQRSHAGESIQIHGTGDQSRTMTYVDDIVTGVTCILESPERHPVVNVTTREVVTVKEMVKVAADVVGSISQIEHVEDREGQIMKEDISNDLLRGMGWEALTSYGEGVRLSYEWYERNGCKWGDQCNKSAALPSNQTELQAKELHA